MLPNLFAPRPNSLDGCVADERDEVSNRNQTERFSLAFSPSVTLNRASLLIGRQLRRKSHTIEDFCRRRALLWCAISLSATWFVWIFSAGFLLNADDVTGHFIWMTFNWEEFWHTYTLTVVQQGRPGQILSNILNYLWLPFLRTPGGSVIILLPSLAFPLALGLYLRRALGEHGILTFVPLTFGLMPLGFHHMPPNSYPWTVYVPLSLILILRAAWPLYEGAFGRGFLLSRLMLAVLFVFTIEYSIVAGAVCLGSEITLRRTTRREGDDKVRRWLNRRVFADLAALASAVIALLVFREFVFDSSYNQMGSSYAGVAITAAKHLGNAFSQFGADFTETSRDDLAHALWIAVPLTLFCILPVARWRGAGLSLRSALFGFFWAISFVLVVSLPAVKQDYCLRGGECIYLDSRLAFYGLVIGITYLLHLASRAFPMRFRVAANFVILLFPVTLTVVHNGMARRQIADYSSAWQRAQLVFCSGGLEAVRQAAVAGRFGNVPFHRRGSFAGVEVGPAEYFQAFARETGCPSSKAFLELIARPDAVISPARSELWPLVSTGFELHDNSLRMIGHEANIDLASRMQRDVNLELEMTFGQARPATLTAPVEVYVNGVKIGSASDPAGQAKERFTVPGGLQNFGHLIVSLVDPSPQPIGVLIESIRFRPLSSSLQAQTTEIQFRQGAGRSPFLLSGWSSSETWGVWTQGEQASLYFPAALLGVGSFDLDFTTDAFMAPLQGVSSQRVIISANGVSLGERRLDGDTAGFLVTVPEGIVGQSSQGLTLRFDLPDHNSPARMELSADARELALGLKTIILRRRP